MSKYICLEHMARPLTEDELETARAERTAVCSADLACTDLVAYAVSWRYTNQPGGPEWIGAALVCAQHAEAFASHHDIDLGEAGLTTAHASHGGDQG